MTDQPNKQQPNNEDSPTSQPREQNTESPKPIQPPKPPTPGQPGTGQDASAPASRPPAPSSGGSQGVSTSGTTGSPQPPKPPAPRPVDQQPPSPSGGTPPAEQNKPNADSKDAPKPPAPRPADQQPPSPAPSGEQNKPNADSKDAPKLPSTGGLSSGGASYAPKPATSIADDVRTCRNCGYFNRPGVLVCENCAHSLVVSEAAAVDTKKFGKDKETGPLTETGEMVALAVNTAGSGVFTETMVLRLEIDGASTPILLHPKSETSIGRRDPATGTQPDVDLTSYAGYRLGVSRKHAVIRRNNQQLEIFDLGSSNGTQLNGVRLQAHQPQPLRDGDEVTLGKMLIRVLFQQRHQTRRLNPNP